MAQTLEEMHNAAYKAMDREDNFNYGDDEPTWRPVARDVEFEKHIAKLRAMKEFNRGK